MRTLRAAWTLAASLSLTLPVGAADLATAEGAEVRLFTARDAALLDAETGGELDRLRTGAELRGRLALAERETLVLRLPDGRRVRLERDALARLEERVPSTIGRRAGRGALIGGSLGFAVGLLGSASCEGDFLCGGSFVLVATAIVTATGGALGAVIGAASGRPAHWRNVTDVRPPVGSNTSGQTRRAATGAGLTLRF